MKSTNIYRVHSLYKVLSTVRDIVVRGMLPFLYKLTTSLNNDRRIKQ